MTEEDFTPRPENLEDLSVEELEDLKETWWKEESGIKRKARDITFMLGEFESYGGSWTSYDKSLRVEYFDAINHTKAYWRDKLVYRSAEKYCVPGPWLSILETAYQKACRLKKQKEKEEKERKRQKLLEELSPPSQAQGKGRPEEHPDRGRGPDNSNRP